MNKKIIVSIVLISIFCLTIVSALNFKEAFDKVVNEPLDNLITGKSFIEKFIQPPLTRQACDKVGGKDYTKKGTISFQNDPLFGTGSRQDFCSGNVLTEWYCVGDVAKYEEHDCGVDICSNGACVAEVIPPPGVWHSIKPGEERTCPEDGFVSGWRDPNSDWVQDSFLCCKPTSTELLPQEKCELVRISQGKEVYCPEGKYVAGWIDDVYADWRQDAFLCCEPGTTGDNTYGCSDTDNGLNIFVKGITKDPFNSKTDVCRVQGYDTEDKKYYWVNEPLTSCKQGMGLWAGRGFVHTCSVEESFCDTSGILKTEKIAGNSNVECPTKICYKGQCACENDADCGAGYTCTKWNDDLRAKFCEKSEEPTPTITPGCLSDSIYYPIGARKGTEEYCDINTQGNYEWMDQKTLTSTCVNSWECETGLCVQGECIEITATGAPIPTECVGCLVNNICLPSGTRKAGEYCGLDSTGNYNLLTQKAKDDSCENDYECESNICVQGECVEPKQDTGFLKQIWCKILHPISTTNYEACLVD